MWVHVHKSICMWGPEVTDSVFIKCVPSYCSRQSLPEPTTHLTSPRVSHLPPRVGIMMNTVCLHGSWWSELRSSCLWDTQWLISSYFKDSLCTLEVTSFALWGFQFHTIPLASPALLSRATELFPGSPCLNWPLEVFFCGFRESGLTCKSFIHFE